MRGHTTDKTPSSAPFMTAVGCAARVLFATVASLALVFRQAGAGGTVPVSSSYLTPRPHFPALYGSIESLDVELSPRHDQGRRVAVAISAWFERAKAERVEAQLIVTLRWENLDTGQTHKKILGRPTILIYPRANPRAGIGSGESLQLPPGKYAISVRIDAMPVGRWQPLAETAETIEVPAAMPCRRRRDFWRRSIPT